MTEQDIISLLIGYVLFCIFVFAYVLMTMRRLCPGAVIPKFLLFDMAITSLLPIVNIALLVNTIRLKVEE